MKKKKILAGREKKFITSQGATEKLTKDFSKETKNMEIKCNENTMDRRKNFLHKILF